MNWAWENVLCCYFVQREELYPYSSKYWVLLQIICRASLRFNRDCKEYKCDFFVIHDLEKNILVKIDIVLKNVMVRKETIDKTCIRQLHSKAYITFSFPMK